jgi:YegS/Rv2252/BmrU family lipid kinase
MYAFKHLLFIVNKYSGPFYHPRVEGTIIETCARHQIECRIKFTEKRGHATELAKNGIGNYDAILAVGGDGTVNEVARALVDTSTLMGIIPKGSGNGLARHLKIPMDIEKAIDAILTGKRISIDTFRVNNTLAINVSGIGFDGHIANLFGENHKRGFYEYVRLVIREYFSYREFTWLWNETSQQHSSIIIALANSSQYGNNAFIAPSASVNDGILNISVVKKIPLYHGLSYLFRLFNRSLKPNDLFRFYESIGLTISSEIPLPYHVDGEPCGFSKNFKIQLFPGSLDLMIPSETQP